MAHDVGVSARTKHFDRAIHYLRDLTLLRTSSRHTFDTDFYRSPDRLATKIWHRLSPEIQRKLSAEDFTVYNGIDIVGPE